MRILPKRFLSHLAKIVFYLTYLGKEGKYVFISKRNPEALFKTRNRSSDKLVLYETWSVKPYEDNRFPIENQRVIIDIGAHIGDFCIYIAKKNPKATIYAFEPYRENYRLLFYNVKQNKVRKGVHVINKAVSSVSGNSQTLYITDGNGAIASLTSQNERKKEKVDTIKFNDFIREKNIRKIDFLKIDAEGSEYEILFSISNENFQKIRYIVLEVHNVKSLSYKPEDLLKFLKSKGFQVKMSSGFSILDLILGTRILKAWRENYA